MKKYIYVIILMCFWGITGCQKNDLILEAPDALNQKVVFTLNLPLQQTAGPATYSISTTDENKIATVDVLVFKVINGQELFAYHKQGIVAGANNVVNQESFYADLPKSEESYRFVVLCNIHDEINNAAASLTLNRPKDELLASLIKVQTGKWNAVSSANFSPFPMWGESVVVNGISANTSNLTFSMLRSLAAIDVTMSAAATQDFLITSVNLYRSNDRGLIIPTPANYDAATKSVTQTSLITSTQLPVQTYNLSSPSTSFKQEIYLFESKAAPSMNNVYSTGLVIGGRYKGSTVNSYYRVEMVNSSGALIPLLRNHRYTVNITSVRGVGFAGRETAWYSKNNDMNVTVIPWSEANLAAVTIPEAYDFSVSRSVFMDDGGTKPIRITINTGYSGGWTASSNATWLTPMATSGAKGLQQAFGFNVTRNTTGAIRTGNVTLTSGKIIKRITVTQAVPWFKEDVPGIPFYIANIDLPETTTWYLAGNVTDNYNVNADATSTPVSPYRTGSCANVYGEGWRIASLEELNLLIPDSEADRNAMNTLLVKNSVNGFPLENNYWANESAPGLTLSASMRGSKRADGSSRTSYNYKTTKYYVRCVKTKPL